jgi:hypothetical protein
VIRALLGPRRRGRTLLVALGIVAASLVVGTGATVATGLAGGFDRAAVQADLPQVIARFDPERRATLDRRVRALPNLAARAYRREIPNVPIAANGRSSRKAQVQVVLGSGRRGYAITAGRDLGTAPGEAVVERGLASAWHLRPGDTLDIGRGGALRIVGVALSPDNVAFPLTVTPRVYVGAASIDPRARPIEPNLALLWLVDPGRADVTLVQARATSFGVGNLQFITRDGIRLLLDQAAGLVIGLLVAFALVALVAAAAMLATGAHAEVQRRLPSLGVQRALGFTPARLVGRQAAEAALVALPAAALGLAAGALAVVGPSADLLAQLNEQPPGAALLPVLAACLAAIVALVAAAAAWPAWRAVRRPPAAIIRGGALATRRRGRRPGGGSLLALGARFALAARGRFVAALLTVGVCVGVVALMLSLASLLGRLRDDPTTVGKRYQLTAQLPADRLGAVRAIPGVDAATLRYEAPVADAFRLGEPLTVIAFPGDHTRFEAPPLAAGRRIRAADEAEVGQGLADALGLRPGARLAVQGSAGEEVRFRVVGVVRALEHDGREAFVRPAGLLRAVPSATPRIAIRVTPGADRTRITAALTALGARTDRVGGSGTRDAGFLAVLVAVLRGVGLAVGLVCLYALVQALAITARERRAAVALLRATGATRGTVATVLAGSALVLAVPALVAGIALEWLVLGPLVGRLAAGFADLPLAPSLGQAALVAVGLLLIALAATAIVARQALREPVVAGLRDA